MSRDNIHAIPGAGMAGPDNALYVRRRKGDHKIGPTTGQKMRLRSGAKQSELNKKSKHAPGPSHGQLGKPDEFIESTCEPLPHGFKSWNPRRTELDPNTHQARSKSFVQSHRGAKSRKGPTSRRVYIPTK